MLIAGVFFIIGVILNAAAVNIEMLIIGRILLGCGVGFANQAVPLFLSEIAPTRIRGGLNILFQLNVTIGILFANLVNYGTAKIKGGWGWRVSLGLAGIPALLLTVGSLMVVDTPNSLIERGHLDEGKAVLKKIRGVDNVEPEYLELVEASRVAKLVQHPFRNLLKRRNRPQLIIAMALQIFQQLTGINAIMFYAPVLFSTLGFKDDASLYSAVITGAVNVISTVVSIYSVDKVGRRFLLLEAGVQMFISQTVIAVILGLKLKDSTQSTLPSGLAIMVVIMVSWAERDRLRQPPVHFRDRPVIPVDAVPFQVRDLLVLLELGSGHVGFRAVSGTRDEERADRGDDGEGLEAALAVEEIWERDKARVARTTRSSPANKLFDPRLCVGNDAIHCLACKDFGG
ncbi:hypothetical protein RHSIM_Rhsim04G0205800 [Rhododendron simsii]|uniref:Major facilitator superfamily (MFS) profile domain-containing protein n=1 Tax=Rhododendron simsii TaxID=118357 RepID=A0A834GXU5_RHOSS|nr:hypothetical protein RHSIM_Rhsim04G0205800 [Rhododendron simsii]